VGLNRHMSVQPVWRGAWPNPGEPLAIVLPGRDQPVQFALEIVTRLSLPSLNCVALSAERNTWYPGRFMEPIESNQPDVDHSLECIESLVAEAESRGIPRTHIALVGFSQGACLVCEYVYRHPVRWGAAVAFTGGLFGPENQHWETEGPGLADTPLLLTNSDADPWVPLVRTQQTAAVFRALGADVHQPVYPARQHEVSDAEISDARKLLLALMAACAKSGEVAQGKKA
jgi:phospholipase/carboxylesterase